MRRNNTRESDYVTSHSNKHISTFIKIRRGGSEGYTLEHHVLPLPYQYTRPGHTGILIGFPVSTSHLVKSRDT